MPLQQSNGVCATRQVVDPQISALGQLGLIQPFVGFVFPRAVIEYHVLRNSES
jgi:hypothetical protein